MIRFMSASVGKSLQVVGSRWVGDLFGSVGESWDRFGFEELSCFLNVASVWVTFLFH